MWCGAMRDEAAVYDDPMNGCGGRWKPLSLFGKLAEKLKGYKNCSILPTLVSRSLKLVYHVSGFKFSVLYCQNSCLEKRIVFCAFLYRLFVHILFVPHFLRVEPYPIIGKKVIMV